MQRVACLHTTPGNVAVFDAACSPGMALHHAVHADLLAAAEAAGSLTEALARRTAALLVALSATADAVVLTCSTLGPAAALADAAAVPVLRVDAALAEAALRGSGRVVVLCAAPTTLAPTGALFRQAAPDAAARVDVRLVPGAWALFRAGDEAGYHRSIAAVADAVFAEGPGCVALAQASMAGAAALCRAGLPLTSPASGLLAARAAILGSASA